jgi:predicted ribosome quality control (RQC) complex YloA/Tae2 family protein
MDYLSLKAAVTEIARIFSGHTISDAWQAGKSEVVLVQRKGPGLVLSIDPVRPGIYLLEKDHLPERTPSPFTDLLRARIKGTTLGTIEITEPGERVVNLTFAAAWPVKKGVPLKIILEVMGRRSNLMLIKEGLILQPLRAVPKEKSPVRPVIAGETYIAPPRQAGTPVEDVTAEDTLPPGSMDDAAAIRNVILGLSPYTAAQALSQALKEPSEGFSGAVPDLVRVLVKMVASSTGERGFLHITGGKAHLSPFEPEPVSDWDKIDSFTPFSEAAKAWRSTSSPDAAENGDENERLERGLGDLLKRINSALEHVDAEEERCQGHDELRIMAETLLIHAGRIHPGLESISLPDPYDPGIELTVPLDRTKSPQENANDLFVQARRLKRGLEETRSRRDSLVKDQEEAQQALEAITGKDDPDPARKLLGPSQPEPRKGGKGKQFSYDGPGRRHTVDGFTILVGKSSTDNENVTFKAAGPNDLWLHARDYPGSHVVIITEKRHVPDKVLYEAAALAAAGSGARNDTAPQIMVTERKWVRKLKGGKPGKVTVERFKTIRPRANSPKAKTQRPKGKDRG